MKMQVETRHATIEIVIVWELVLSTKQSLQSDTLLYAQGTIIANVEFFFTWEKNVNTVWHSLKL